MSVPPPTTSAPPGQFTPVPLTTTFTPPGAQCTGVYSSDIGDGSGWVAVVANDLSCMPPSYTIDPTNFFYSPGIACPSGYETACYDSVGDPSITTVTW
ncbi:hypothetical protein MMYC01_202278 [Madurella mycetomatis]|uniref:Uncharacterized protein n=1 Tax=Madurella mycetomatis TaxID=100816 RepID=A0A175W8S1_9PEZI|nr:hypothetical protein MMYC01_202278 [Madurella mycetomatis]